MAVLSRQQLEVDLVLAQTQLRRAHPLPVQDERMPNGSSAGARAESLKGNRGCCLSARRSPPSSSLSETVGDERRYLLERLVCPIAINCDFHLHAHARSEAEQPHDGLDFAFTFCPSHSSQTSPLVAVGQLDHLRGRPGRATPAD